MAITTRNITNIGSPPDDPTCPLPGILYIPDSAVHPPPWPCVIGSVAPGFGTGSTGGEATRIAATMTDLANAGFLCLNNTVRLMVHHIAGQTTDGKYQQQTDDEIIAVRYMRAAGGITGLGYSVTGFVASVGGSASAHHAGWVALTGTLGDDKVDAAILLSPPLDFSDRPATPGFVNNVTQYGRSTDLGVLLSESPISFNLALASPILHYNGDAENMPLTQWTRFKAAMIAAGAVDYTAIENTGTLGTLHSFGIWVGGGGATGVGPDAVAWLLARVTPPPPPAPNPPSVLTATAISTSAIDLGWHDNSANEDGFKIERSLDGTTWAEIFVTAPNIVVFHDTGLTSSTLYFYRVRAFNAGGDSAYSNTASATTNNPPPLKLHTPTYTPSGSVDSNTDTTITCSDAGTHLFYTLGASPFDPTHTGDTPTGSTFRINSSSGTVNSGAGVNLFKTLAYKPGFTDSDIAVSDTFGTPPVTTLQPILTGIMELLSTDRVPPDRLGDISGFPAWHFDFVDGFRYRGCWNNLEPTEGNFFWDDLDAIFALAAANNKFLSISIASGTFTPQWVYDSGAASYNMHDPNNLGLVPLYWDPAYQVKWFAFLNALAVRYAGNNQLRAMIDTGFMPVASMLIGDLDDEAAMPFVGSGFSYLNVHDAYRAAAQSILATTFSLFPNIGHAITYTNVWPDDAHKDANFVRDWYQNTYAPRTGTITTSARATLPPHTAPDPNLLSANPNYAQEFWPMSARATGKTYVPPEPPDLPPALQCIQDCLEHMWETGHQYLEMYKADIEFGGVGPTLTIEGQKLKDNLLGELPPTCPSGQHWDPDKGECVPDTPPTCPEGQHWDPIQLKCVPDSVPLPPAFKRMLPILENAQLGTDIDFQNNFLLNPGLLLPCPDGILEINDVRLVDARGVPDGSVTNDSIALNAGIEQSKLNFNGNIRTAWLGNTSSKAARGDLAQFLSEKGQPDGYVPLRDNGTFDPSFLASTGPQTGTIPELKFQISFVSGATLLETIPSLFLYIWEIVPNNSYLGVNGIVKTAGRFTQDPTLDWISKPMPVGIIPDIDASIFTLGTFDKSLMPVAVGMGVGHAAGMIPDPGSSVKIGSETDYLGRNMLWHSFEDVINPQPKAPFPNIILLSYYREQGSILIKSVLGGSNLFYRVVDSFIGTPYRKAPSTDFPLLVDVGSRVDAYSAKAGYNNSEISSFTVPPIPTG